MDFTALHACSPPRAVTFLDTISAAERFACVELGAAAIEMEVANKVRLTERSFGNITVTSRN
jgi:hypothetical protein